MKKNDKYNYTDGKQIEEHGSRIYDVAGYRLPSVTTILGKTKDQSFLKEWKAKVGEDAIVDFKQSNRPKKKEWIEDYYLQIAAYAMAHDYVHKSTIKKGVIMVCTPDLYYQEFVVEGAELRQYKHKFLKRLDMYHELKFDEKEQHNSEKENEEYLKELKEKL
jgi:hypothetical protein